jgi:hypothetical protein
MIHSACRAALAALALGVFGCAASEPSPAVPLASASPEEPLPPSDDTGQLSILCNPPTPVLVDGKPAGTTPINAFRVPPGSHDVTFVDELSGNRTMTVSIGPGEGRSVVSDRPPNAVMPPEKPEQPAKKPGKK